MSTSFVHSYEKKKPTVTIKKKIFIPDFPNINFINEQATFIKCMNKTYVFQLNNTYNNKIIILTQDDFIWNRYP